ncbi:hypothetical protein Q3G72_029404 [Acer saccharum]|nr:hypothetical protein Q3G72_029404 [Acer saccharum]
MLISSSQPATGATAGFTFGRRPLALDGLVGAVAAAEGRAVMAFFGGLSCGLPLPPELFFFDGAIGANRSLGFGGRPRGHGGDTTTPAGSGALGLGGRPRRGFTVAVFLHIFVMDLGLVWR